MCSKISATAAIALAAVAAGKSPLTSASCRMVHHETEKYAGSLYIVQGCNDGEPISFTAKGWRLGKDLEGVTVGIYEQDPLANDFTGLAKHELGTWAAQWWGSFGFIGQQDAFADIMLSSAKII